MAYVQINKDKYNQPVTYSRMIDVYNEVFYLVRPFSAQYQMVGVSNNLMGINPYLNPGFIAEQMLAVQIDRSVERRLYHIIISPDPILELGDINGKYRNNTKLTLYNDIEFLMNLGQFILKMYPDYQSFFTVHNQMNRTPHVHILFNNCPIDSSKPTLTKVFNKCSIYKAVDAMIDARRYSS